MLKFEFANAAEVAKRIGAMIGHVSYFGNVEMGKELSAWQTEDMHRQRSATRKTKWRRHQKSALTIIRPHSLYEVTRSQQYQKRVKRKLRSRKAAPTRWRAPRTAHVRLKTSMRPILRESLYQQFVQRLGAAFSETITWKL